MDTQTTRTNSTDVRQIFGNPALDFACDRLYEGEIAQTMDELFEDLRTRRTDESETWREYAGDCLNHPLRDLLHQDPFTHRAFAKPRGYAGDAVMMDYIYGLGEAGEAAAEATPLGRAIFTYMSSRPSAKAVRYRRQLIAKTIDRVASRGSARVLAIAAGHLREVELSSAVRDGQIDEFIAIDQDPASLAVIERDYARFGVQTIEGSVRQILAGKVKLGQFDFVYAAGLFDYLSAPVAAALARRMFEMTKPGGVMLIPNFLGSVRDRGYMESFMDWRLIYRNHADMQAIATALPEGSVAERQIFDDEDDAIVFLVVSKASTMSVILGHEPQRERDREMALAFEVRARAEQTAIDAEAIGEIETHAAGRLPAFFDVARAAAQLNTAETLFESTAERCAVKAVTEFRDDRRAIRVVGHVAPRVHWQFDTHVSHWHRIGILELAAREKGVEYVARPLRVRPRDAIGDAVDAETHLPGTGHDCDADIHGKARAARRVDAIDRGGGIIRQQTLRVRDEPRARDEVLVLEAVQVVEVHADVQALEPFVQAAKQVAALRPASAASAARQRKAGAIATGHSHAELTLRVVRQVEGGVWSEDRCLTSEQRRKSRIDHRGRLHREVQTRARIDPLEGAVIFLLELERLAPVR